MDKISASITSKGQITLPKTIRDLMNLNTSDQIHFNIEPDGRVFIEKDKRGTESLHIEVNSPRRRYSSHRLGNDTPIN